MNITDKLNEFTYENPGNCISAEKALRKDLEGMQIFGTPLVGVASADDPLFDKMKEPGVIGPHFMKPCDWLPDAKSVISIFMPYKDTIKKSN